jgi:homoserine dehydrogenase
MVWLSVNQNLQQINFLMKKIRIGLAGLGNVGQGVYEILQKDSNLISKRAGCSFEIVAVCARNKKNFINEKIKFYQNPIDLASDPEVDLVIEVIGGEKLGKEIAETAIKNGKKLITANKAMIASFGFEIAKLAEEKNIDIAFEAAVAGSIPIIKIFKEGFAANKIEQFYGILNGTCNFILSKMEKENLDFSLALKQAQELGYAEADPSADIDGYDTAYKLFILATIALGKKIDFNQIYIDGIRSINIDDIKLAEELGYKIKLLGIYKNFADKIEIATYPALVSKQSNIAQIDDSYNAILTKNSNAEFSFISGRGAGKLPTASAVVADLIDVSNNRFSKFFGSNLINFSNEKISEINHRFGKYFLKFSLNKQLTKNKDLSKEIFFDKVKIDKSFFVDKDQEILCGIITQNHQEAEIIEIARSVDFKLVSDFKFLRIEEIEQ